MLKHRGVPSDMSVKMVTSMRARFRATPLLGVVLVLLSMVPLTLARPAMAADESAVSSAVENDEAVQRARAARERAQIQRDAVARSLDGAAAEFEHARGQAEQLATEAESVRRELASVEREVGAAKSQTADRAVAAYLAPSRQLSLTQFVLGAEDAESALYLAGLIRHMGHRSNTALENFERVEDLHRDETRQQHVVTAGAHAAADERRRAAGRLQAALDDAARVVRTAEETVASAEQDAAERERERQRLEAERKARAEAERLARVQRERAVAADASSAVPPAAVNGRVCPVGSPNGFIDSWGFPRSGGRSHKGIDMFAAYGTAQFAVADGVVDTGSNRLGGLTIWLTDDSGNRYYYAHLASIEVADGARVQAGQVIGTTGTSGNAAGTPPHLHWQYHPGGGEAVNPYPLAVALCR